jgi:glycosyltransferase involved in cell wall biosynthesis
MSSKKRILIFSLAYHPVIGGAEVAVKEITDRVKDIDFDLITLRFDNKHPEREQIGNVCVYRISASKLTYPIQAAMFAKVLHKEKSYSAIWSIMAARAGAAALFFKYNFPEVPYILTLQEGDPIWYMKLRSLYYINPFFRKIFTHADVIQVISNYLADYARAMGYQGDIELIPNGVDTKFFSQIPDKEKIEKIKKELGKEEGDIFLVTTSRLIGKNAIFDVIRSLPHLAKNIKFAIVGTGPSLKKLKSLVQDLHLKERVKFVGHVKYTDVPLYLHASDIFIRPSLSEGFGNSFIEAMAAGLPVVATPVGGITDFLFDPDKNPDKDPTGLFVTPRDHESIARQVRRLTKDEELRELLVKNGKKLVKESYEWDLIANEMQTRVFDRI